MKWEGQRESENVEDRRADGGRGSTGLGGLGGRMPGGRGLGLGGIVLALLVSWALGINPLTVLGLLQGGRRRAAGRCTCRAAQRTAGSGCRRALCAHGVG